MSAEHTGAEGAESFSHSIAKERGKGDETENLELTRRQLMGVIGGTSVATLAGYLGLERFYDSNFNNGFYRVETGAEAQNVERIRELEALLQKYSPVDVVAGDLSITPDGAMPSFHAFPTHERWNLPKGQQSPGISRVDNPRFKFDEVLITNPIVHSEIVKFENPGKPVYEHWLVSSSPRGAVYFPLPDREPYGYNIAVRGADGQWKAVGTVEDLPRNEALVTRQGYNGYLDSGFQAEGYLVKSTQQQEVARLRADYLRDNGELIDEAFKGESVVKIGSFNS